VLFGEEPSACLACVKAWLEGMGTIKQLGLPCPQNMIRNNAYLTLKRPVEEMDIYNPQ